MLSEPEFRKLADDELKSISRALDRYTELTVDYANETLTIEFDDGDKFVLNEQGPTRQIWFAAAFEAAHFELDPTAGQWKDTKRGEELHARVSKAVGEKLKKPVSI